MKVAIVSKENTKNSKEPAHGETYNKTCASSEDSDQPAHSRSLISLRRLQPPDSLKVDKREPLSYWVEIQADLSLLDT